MAGRAAHAARRLDACRAAGVREAVRPAERRDGNEQREGEAMTATIERPKLTHRQILLLMSGHQAVMLLAALDLTIVGTALQTIVGKRGGTEHDSWVVT